MTCWRAPAIRLRGVFDQLVGRREVAAQRLHHGLRRGARVDSSGLLARAFLVIADRRLVHLTKAIDRQGDVLRVEQPALKALASEPEIPPRSRQELRLLPRGKRLDGREGASVGSAPAGGQRSLDVAQALRPQSLEQVGPQERRGAAGGLRAPPGPQLRHVTQVLPCGRDHAGDLLAPGDQRLQPLRQRREVAVDQQRDARRDRGVVQHRVALPHAHVPQLQELVPQGVLEQAVVEVLRLRRGPGPAQRTSVDLLQPGERGAHPRRPCSDRARVEVRQRPVVRVKAPLGRHLWAERREVLEVRPGELTEALGGALGSLGRICAGDEAQELARDPQHQHPARGERPSPPRSTSHTGCYRRDPAGVHGLVERRSLARRRGFAGGLLAPPRATGGGTAWADCPGWGCRIDDEEPRAMATAKQVALEIVGSLPDDCTLKDAAYRLYLRQLVEEAREDFREGRTFTQEEVEREAAEWLEP